MAGVDDPMFTSKALLTCASCTKGVNNLQGYRADHVNWDGFPFKEPGKRMLKSGMGFARMFAESQTNIHEQNKLTQSHAAGSLYKLDNSTNDFSENEGNVYQNRSYTQMNQSMKHIR